MGSTGVSPTTARPVAAGAVGEGSPCHEEAMSLSLNIMHRVGMWSVTGSSAYRLYTVVMCSGYPLYYLMMAWVFSAGGDTTAHVTNVGDVLSFVPVTFNVVLVLLKRRQLEEVVDNLRTYFARTSCGHTAAALRGAVKEEKILVGLLSSTIMSACLLLLGEPLVAHYASPPDANSSVALNLVLKLYTSEEMGSRAFAALYALQCFVLLSMFLTFVHVEGFLSVLILYAATQFDMLISLIRNVERLDGCLEAEEGCALGQSQTGGNEARALSGDGPELISENLVVQFHDLHKKSTENHSYSKKNRDIARVWEKLVVLHQEALRNALMLCEILRMVLLLNYALTSVIMCIILYQSNAEDAFKMVYCCFYMASISSRLFIVSILSTRLSTKSMQISDEVAATEWFEYNRGVKVTLVIMMSRAQRPVQMWAGRFAVMSLETFGAIINAAYSYYNVLSNLT